MLGGSGGIHRRATEAVCQLDCPGAVARQYREQPACRCGRQRGRGMSGGCPSRPQSECMQVCRESCRIICNACRISCRHAQPEMWLGPSGC